jgi:hypothetical protein
VKCLREVLGRCPEIVVEVVETQFGMEMVETQLGKEMVGMVQEQGPRRRFLCLLALVIEWGLEVAVD